MTQTTHCPICNVRVYSTHRCLGRPSPLVPIPDDFRDRIAQAKAADEAPVEPLSLWGEAMPALEDEVVIRRPCTPERYPYSVTVSRAQTERGWEQ